MSESNRNKDFDLTGKVAMVTGAGRGMGSHIAQTLARYGADLIICSRTEVELEQVAEKIRGINRKVMICPVDLTRVESLAHMVEACEAHMGGIDILVNNAGINIPQSAEDVTVEAWDQIMDINLKAQFFCAQAVGRRMIERKRGKIIMMSSQAGSVGLLKRAAYCSSKGAINQLTKTLAIEWARHNITVNAIAPTFVEGPFTKPMFEDQEFKNYVLSNIPLGRIGQPGDISGAVIYLASSAADLVTGTVLTIDGGWTAQ
jgi:NAD(P)-dependent dehydrogenase (short-subunit alcohol dehydrogenase family)